MFALSFTKPYSLSLRGDETKVKWVPPKKKNLSKERSLAMTAVFLNCIETIVKIFALQYLLI